MHIRSLAAAAAASAGLALVAGPALAAAPFVVTGGGTVTGTATGNSVLTAGSQQLNCTSSSVGGTITNGTYSTSPATIGHITSASWSGCTWSGGIGATVTVTSPNWDVNITGGNTSGSSDTLTGSIGNIAGAHVALATGCAFDISGLSAGDSTFNETTQNLSVLGTNSSLTVKNVNNSFLCLGLVSNGQSASFAGTYHVTSSGGTVLVS